MKKICVKMKKFEDALKEKNLMKNELKLGNLRKKQVKTEKFKKNGSLRANAL